VRFYQLASEMDAVLYTFLEEEAEEEFMLTLLLRENGHDMYKKRDDEGSFKMLICRHLCDNEIK
jgi:hypothetical protein